MGLFQDFLGQPKQLGGKKAVVFVYATEGLESMAFISISTSLVNYFFGYMNFSLTESATTLTNFMATAFLLALFGGFISDTYLSRFTTCIVFGCLEILGYGLLAVQAHFGELRPSPCRGTAPDQAYLCEKAESGQVAFLFVSLYMIALGNGGMKAALPSLGADQFDEKDPEEAAMMSSFFNWFMFSITIGSMFGVTFIAWILANSGWDWGFGLCFLAVLCGVCSVYMGKSLFRNNVPKGSPLVRVIQVYVAAFKNRNLTLPDMSDELHDIYDSEAGVHQQTLLTTHQFRFLDKAAIVRRSIGASSSSSKSEGAWSLCRVTEVEEAKILLRMIPIIASTVLMNTCMAQLQTFTIQQSTTMDTHFIASFNIPGSSIPIIPLIVTLILIPLYDTFFVPIARNITGIPTGIRSLQRVGIGLVLSAISMAVAGFVETRRKSIAWENDMVDTVEPLPMSVFWLGIQFAIFGAADMFTLVGMMEFFYGESSAGMKSLGTAISWCSIAIGFFLSSLIVQVVNKVSDGWLASDNLNRDKLDYFYWLLAGMSVLNFGFYLMCASWYRYKTVQVKHLENYPNGDAPELVQRLCSVVLQ